MTEKTNDKPSIKETVFCCKGCGHWLPGNFVMRTPEWCYMCDPAVTLEELLTSETLLTNENESPFKSVELDEDEDDLPF